MTSAAQAGQNQTQNQQSEDIVNKILAELKACKPGWRAAFKSQEEVDRYKVQLLKACVENGVKTMEQIEKGLAGARANTSDFFPSQGKFIEWCNGPKQHHEHAAMDMAMKYSKENRERARLENKKPMKVEEKKIRLEDLRKELNL